MFCAKKAVNSTCTAVAVLVVPNFWQLCEAALPYEYSAAYFKYCDGTLVTPLHKETKHNIKYQLVVVIVVVEVVVAVVVAVVAVVVVVVVVVVAVVVVAAVDQC